MGKRSVRAENRSDLGATGMAMRSRPSRVVETIEAGAKQRILEEPDPISHYRRNALLTDRQCDALQRLAEHYDASGRRCAVSAGYGQRVGGIAEMSDDQAEAFSRYSRLLGRAPEDCRHALACVAATEFPGVVGHMDKLRRGTTAMADHLRLPA